jgi:hypothetical protein
LLIFFPFSLFLLNLSLTSITNPSNHPLLTITAPCHPCLTTTPHYKCNSWLWSFLSTWAVLLKALYLQCKVYPSEAPKFCGGSRCELHISWPFASHWTRRSIISCQSSTLSSRVIGSSWQYSQPSLQCVCQQEYPWWRTCFLFHHQSFLAAS